MKCKNCSTESDSKYCPNCGQELVIHRITVPHLLHEIVHTFTHLEKGFLYTLKKLFTDPGRMQRVYLEGFRVNYQKPFSMFFICATISALSLYWINRFSGNSADGRQAAFNYFLQHYYVLLHIILLPFYTLVTWLLFIRSKYNYAEILVLGMYMLAFLLLLLVPMYAISAGVPVLKTRLFETVLFAIYNVWTFIRFFNKTPWWMVIVLSIINMVINYLVYVYIMDWVVTDLLAK
ncbi:MAG TPA: DUF3667 domain-containing protein [Chitinophagaceae bacterium]|nr:DUF3667 domain-containing protein [Chitinophagaceae bacterium]